MNTLEQVEAGQSGKETAAIRPGETVRVHVKVVEGEKERTQVFEGIVIRISGKGHRTTFTVRKVSYGVGVERIFPLHTSRIEKIEIVARGHVRRARLNYLRDLQGKAARIKGEKQAEEPVSREEPPAGGSSAAATSTTEPAGGAAPSARPPIAAPSA